MPAQSKIAALPEDVRAELDRRLIAGGFSDYRGLADWLSENGCEISHVAVHRHGQEVQRQIEMIRLATDNAKALRDATGDDTDALADGAMRMIQAQMWKVLAAGGEGDVRALSQAARALADTARASVTIQQERRKVLGEAAEAAGTEARRLGMPPDFEAAIRKHVQALE